MFSPKILPCEIRQSYSRLLSSTDSTRHQNLPTDGPVEVRLGSQSLFREMRLRCMLNICFVFGSLSSAHAAPSPKDSSSPTTDSIFPISFVGNIASLQQTNFAGDTRIYMQQPDNSITELNINGPLSSARLVGTMTLVPAAEVQFQSLIAAVSLDPGAFGVEAHVFFISPQNTLAEYFTANNQPWKGGVSCTTCIDRQGFAVQPGNRVLYAMSTQAPEGTGNFKLRVGFVSAGSPGTLSEAEFNPSTGWKLVQLQA
ncbi:hypothetical protein MIND_01206900 [Mycena indigotica]|uniref:Uncharacterized protein n=1 Tax=Mycena indigotica TaxID=2126181 RepID=A0A8H6S4N6_9AGAR|nr:uncharacterized protein MIND_01206900 [Mycena indigotica]KAF7293075.1 hypothetical protein MIND_01206900 [Mycena indigotica]